MIDDVVTVGRTGHRLQDRREVGVRDPQPVQVAGDPGDVVEPELGADLQPVGAEGGIAGHLRHLGIAVGMVVGVAGGASVTGGCSGAGRASGAGGASVAGRARRHDVGAPWRGFTRGAGVGVSRGAG